MGGRQGKVGGGAAGKDICQGKVGGGAAGKDTTVLKQIPCIDNRLDQRKETEKVKSNVNEENPLLEAAAKSTAKSALGQYEHLSTNKTILKTNLKIF